MKIPKIFDRDELSRTLWGFRYEFMVAGVFSMVANVLMLTPTFYMLQVYDRVMQSKHRHFDCGVAHHFIFLWCAYICRVGAL